MDTMKLNNGQVLKISPCLGFEFILKENMTVEELEQLLNEDNLSHVEFSTSYGSVYGKYDNLKLVTITKYVEQNYILFNLKEES